jgi:hypothetical protein
MAVLIAKSLNNEGRTMQLSFSTSNSWQAFSIDGLPRRLSKSDGKAMSLAKAIEMWNMSVKDRASSLSVSGVSARMRVILDAVRDAKKEQVNTPRAAPAMFNSSMPR